MPRGRWPVALLALAILLAGCGGYTKHDFIARADAICASTVRQTRLIPAPNFAQPGTRPGSALAHYVGAVLPLVQSEAKQLRALPRPSGGAPEKAALARFLAAFDGVVADYRDLATTATRTDAQGMAHAEAVLTASPVASLAAAYGLHSCGAAGATSA